MTGIPPPPRKFAALKLIVEEFSPPALLRMAWTDSGSWCRFNWQSRNRFDSSNAAFGVMYAAADLATAFAETVLRDKPAGSVPGTQPILGLSELKSRVVVSLQHSGAARSLRLIKLYDHGLAAAHIDNRIATVDDYAITNLWADALHTHPVMADGIVYMSRYMGARQSVALFDRCAAAIAPGEIVPLMAHSQFPTLIDDFALAIDPDG